MTNEDLYRLEYDWRFWGRPKQFAPTHADWFLWVILCGRGFGKTRTGVEWVRSLASNPNGPGSCSIIADTPGDIRKFIIEGPSGFLNCCPKDEKPTYIKSRTELIWPNGFKASLFSAEDPESLRGASGSHAWWDEFAKSRYAAIGWENLLYGLREEDPKVLVTTTPRPTKVMKELLREPDIHLVTGSSYENASNLSEMFYEKIIKPREGTRMGRQEIYGDMLTDTIGALWSYETLDKFRLNNIDIPLKRIVVAVDPPATSGEDSDECGIIVYGLGEDNHGYVLADESEQGLTPNEWATKAYNAYVYYQAGRIIAETNQGGEMVESVIRNVDPNVSYKGIRASKGKVTRAEPAASLYERGMVHHVGTFSKLEDQMTGFTVDFDKKKSGYSPDRVDALVWAITECHSLQGEFYVG